MEMTKSKVFPRRHYDADNDDHQSNLLGSVSLSGWTRQLLADIAPIVTASIPSVLLLILRICPRPDLGIERVWWSFIDIDSGSPL